MSQRMEQAVIAIAGDMGAPPRSANTVFYMQAAPLDSTGWAACFFV